MANFKTKSTILVIPDFQWFYAKNGKIYDTNSSKDSPYENPNASIYLGTHQL